MPTSVFPDPQSVARAVAEAWRAAAAQGDGPFHIALAGGTTPKLVYRTLAEPAFKDAIPWHRVHLYWGDERCVSPDHAESNFAMVEQALLKDIDIPQANVHRIRGENAPQQEAHRYAAEIRESLQTPHGQTPRFDWILLGLGEDGHTASLFPNVEPEVEPSGVCAVARHPDSGQQRITLTAVVLDRAQRVSFIVTGERKAGIVAQILNASPGQSIYPAANVRPDDGRLEWFLDQAAATGLNSSSP